MVRVIAVSSCGSRIQHNLPHIESAARTMFLPLLLRSFPPQAMMKFNDSYDTTPYLCLSLSKRNASTLRG